MEQVVEIIFQVFALYFSLGFLFSIVFVIWGVWRIDPAAKNTTWSFRLIILPGVIVFWPLLALRCLRNLRQSGSRERGQRS